VAWQSTRAAQTRSFGAPERATVTLFIRAREFLEAIDPNAPWACLVAASWLGTYAARRWAPTLWAALLKWGPEGGVLEHALQTLPGAMASAAFAALGTGGDALAAAKGAAVSLLAPIAHHVLKASPLVPYRGAMGLSVTGPESRRRIVDEIE
jgi:hypothetical protein